MVAELLKLLKSFTEEEIKLLESKDRQYRALKKLFSAVREPELFLKLVVINALLSYQLQMKGEDYWETFSRFFSENPNPENFEEFLNIASKNPVYLCIKPFPLKPRDVFGINIYVQNNLI